MRERAAWSLPFEHRITCRNMKAAIIGLPQSGKSTVFAAVTGQPVDPFALREPRPAVVRVPDPRLQYLIDLYQPKKVTEATVEFVDVPGCALDDAKGQEDWKRLLPTVRLAELLVVVVRAFPNESVAPYKNRIDPVADFAAVWEEILFADLDAVTTRLHRLEASLKKPTKTHEAEKREQVLLQRCHETLEASKPISAAGLTEEELRHLSSFAFLSRKPIVCVQNVGDDRVLEQGGLAVDHVADSLSLCATIEAEIAGLEAADRGPFLADMGLAAPARDRLIQSCYRAGGFISFLTMGPDEVRAWTIHRTSTAVDAASRIHTDLARGFVRAETVAYADLVANKDMNGARAAGKVRKEGKSYLVADGDILNILHSG